MKINSVHQTLLFSLFLGHAVHAAPRQVDLQVEKIYVPAGFDSNDNIQVIVTGTLPNLCYRAPKSKTLHKGNVFKVSLVATYEETEGTVCAEAVVPFMEKVVLGTLETGSYIIEANEDSPQNLKEALEVVQANSNVLNDHIYARIEFADPMLKTRQVLLKGYNPSECFELDRIETKSNKKDVYSVLPIMKKVGDFCPMKMVPFSYPYEVPADLSAKEILLHVRTMQGDSVNTLFSNN